MRSTPPQPSTTKGYTCPSERSGDTASPAGPPLDAPSSHIPTSSLGSHGRLQALGYNASFSALSHTRCCGKVSSGRGIDFAIRRFLTGRSRTQEMHWTLRATGRHWLKSLLLKSQATEQFQYNDVGSTRWTLSVTRRGSNEETKRHLPAGGPWLRPYRTHRC